MHYRILPPSRLSRSCFNSVLPLSLIAAICGWLCLTSVACRNNPVVVDGPDTTSHAFTWEVTTLGGTGGSSGLYDVAIINDTLAYAVGEIYVAGETGAYNLVKWDGRSWKLLRLWFNTFCGDSASVESYPTRTIWAFSPSAVWVTSGSQITRFDGMCQRVTECIPVSASRLWGLSPSDFYAVGAIGNIVHYNGTSWTKIESGTTLGFNDVCGLTNPATGQEEIYAVAARLDQNKGKRMIRIRGNTVETLPDSGLSWAISGVWKDARSDCYVVGAGIHWKNNPSDTNSWSVYAPGVVTSYFSWAIDGAGPHDIMVAGAFGEIVHFNGASWKNYIDQTGFYGDYTSIRMKDDLAIAVGSDGRHAVIAVGRR